MPTRFTAQGSGFLSATRYNIALVPSMLHSVLPVALALLAFMAAYLWRKWSAMDPKPKPEREPPQRMKLQVGQRVLIVGLGRAELNGRAASVIEFDSKGHRYVVELGLTPAEFQSMDPGRDTKRLRVKPINLQLLKQDSIAGTPLEAADPAAGCCPLCLEGMPMLTWRGNERHRLVCCGRQICKPCWVAAMQRFEDMGRR